MQLTNKNQQIQHNYAGLSSADLLAVIAEKDQLIENQKKHLADKEHLAKDLEAYIALLEERLRLATLKRFSSSSEKMPHQGQLFDEAELEVSLSDLEAEIAAHEAHAESNSETTPKKPKKTARKRAFSEHLTRIQIHSSLTDTEKNGASRTFYTKVKEELDVRPAEARVLEYWQEKAVFDKDDGEQSMVVAQRPVHPLGKCQGSVGLLAHIITSKYADGLPLYRQESILARYGGDVNRATMANWILRLDDVLQPLINLGHESLLESDYLQSDETRLQVLKEPGRSATSDKWMWVLRGGPPDKPFVLFDYDPSRAETVPERLLNGFKGVLQVDGYAGYNKVCAAEGITRIGCWDHARRNFVEASKAAKPATGKKRKAGNPSKADTALGMINRLYTLERTFKDMNNDERRDARQQHSMPVLEKLKVWLVSNVTRVPKGGLTHKAIQYLLNQWHTLTGYCDDGKLHISNVLAENAIRPFAVGRRAWLFSDSPKGAKASATCYTLVESAKANGLEPYAYLLYILQRIGTADSVEQLEALMPWNVALAISKASQYSQSETEIQ